MSGRNCHSRRFLRQVVSLQDHDTLLEMTGNLRIGLYCESSIIGGAERSMFNLVAAYVGPHELVICSPSETVLREAARVVPRVETRLIRSRPSGLGAVIDHRRELRRIALDLLQITLPNPFASRPAMLAAFSLRIPTVAVEQLVLDSERRRGRWLKRAVSRPLTGHVAVGAKSASDLCRFFGLRPNRITVIHNGLAPVDGAPSHVSRRPLIGCAARLEDQKSIDLLIEGMSQLPEVHLMVVGDGSNREALEQLAHTRGVADQVEFVGWVDDARPYVAAFDVFVLPSRAESFPLSIIEAMLAGTPVVATNVGSVAEAVIDGQTGLLVPPNDVGALVGAIRTVLSDDVLRTRLISSARRHAEENFTADAMSTAYAALWSGIDSSRGRRTRPRSAPHDTAGPVNRKDHSGAPRILLITDRKPGMDTGYGMRIANVVAGLRHVGDLHVCLVDSSYGGESLPRDGGYTTSVVRALDPSRLSKLVRTAVSIPDLTYRRAKEVRSDLTDAVGGEVWDLVWCSRIRMHRLSCGIVEGARIVDFDDMNDLLLRTRIKDRTARSGWLSASPRNLADALNVRRWSRLQRSIAEQAERVVVCCEADRIHLGVSDAAIVPNGYRIRSSLARASVPDRPTLLFVGPLTYEPNRLAAEWMSYEVLPRVRACVPEARLVVVGRSHGRSERLRHVDGVELLGYVDSVEPHYSSASLAVAPLWSGSGTSLKAIEALAYSVPLVSTSFGCRGLNVEHGVELLVADDITSFAEHCVRVIRDPDFARQLAARGHTRYRAGLTAEMSSAAVAAVASDVMSKPARSGSRS